MNRSLKLSMLLALALGSSQAAALDLGQIQVKSALGQPLLAEIPLTPDSPAELRNLSVRLASPEDFARAGLTGGRPDVPLQFSIADVGGRKVIRITSTAAVNDPYLDLLVEVDSAAGRSLREFPILLDPPGTAPAAPSVRAPRSHAPRSVASAATASAPAPSTSTTGQAAKGGQYGPVERGETLSGIARKTAPAGVDPKQMMLALKQANPDAFFQDNINALKSGAVLRVPTDQEAIATSVAAALAEVRRQNSDWRGQAARSTTTVADAATRAGTSSAPSNAAAADRLALVPSNEGGKGAGVHGGSGKGDATVRQDLLRSQEQLTTLQQQGAELKSRLKDLQDINDKNTRLLALKDNEIAELQQKLAEARKQAGLPAAPAVAMAPAAGAAAKAGSGAGSTPSAAATAPTTASATPAATATAPAAPGAAPVPATAKHATATPLKPARSASRPAAPAAEAWYMQTWAWGAGAGAVVLLILLALLGRRKSGRDAKPAPASLADRFGVLPAAPDASVDPDQDELLDQLAEHPDDISLHLELVSLYYSRRDVEHFEAAAEAMQAHVVDPQQDEWQDVVAMGQDLSPGHPLFAGHDAEAGRATTVAFAEEQARQQDDAPGAFDLDSYAADAEPAEVSGPARPTVSEYHFDFDLTPPGRSSKAVDEVLAGHADPLAAMDDLAPVAEPVRTTPGWNFESAPLNDTLATGENELGHFSDDPIDTKLDLARAYMDMGDADGARAMLDEVMSEGSQIQKDAAQRLLESLA